MPTSLVTGGAGFLGSHLCEALLERGQRVICLDNLVVSSLENIEHLRDDAFTFVNHDVIEPIAVDEPVDYVYHLAALASPIDYLRMPLHSLKTGSYGTHHALGLAKFKRARFLLTSTSEVYGDPEVHPQPETYWGNVNPIGPRGVYDEAKRYAEALMMAYHRQQGVDTGIVRIFNTYGAAHAAERRARDPDVPAPGARGKARHGVRRRLADAELLLRGRPDPRARPARGVGRASSRQPRQPRREDAARARRDDHPAHRLLERDRLRGAARRRPAGAAAGHHPREATARLAAGRRAGGRPEEDHRLARARGRRRLDVSISLGELYERHHRERRNAGDFVFVPERIPLFQEAIGQGNKVLDLGCRSGALTRHFLDGNDVVGVDVDRAALAKAEQLGITPVVADVEEPLSVRRRELRRGRRRRAARAPRFPETLVAEVLRVLEPGGVFVGSVPNAFRVQSRLRFLLGRQPEKDPTHLHMFSPADIRALLADFEDVELTYVGGRYRPLHPRLLAQDLVFSAYAGRSLGEPRPRDRTAARRSMSASSTMCPSRST